MSEDKKSRWEIDPNDYVSELRQLELMGMAKNMPSTAIRQAIRDAVFAVQNNVVIKGEM